MFIICLERCRIRGDILSADLSKQVTWDVVSGCIPASFLECVMVSCPCRTPERMAIDSQRTTAANTFSPVYRHMSHFAQEFLVQLPRGHQQRQQQVQRGVPCLLKVINPVYQSCHNKTAAAGLSAEQLPLLSYFILRTHTPRFLYEGEKKTTTDTGDQKARRRESSPCTYR